MIYVMIASEAEKSWYDNENAYNFMEHFVSLPKICRFLVS